MQAQPTIQHIWHRLERLLHDIQTRVLAIYAYPKLLYFLACATLVYLYLLPPPDKHDWQGIAAHKQIGSMLRGEGFLGDVLADVVGMRAMCYHEAELYPILGPAFAQMGIVWDVQHRSTHPPMCNLLTLPIAFLLPPYQQWLWLFMVLAAYAVSFWALGARPGVALACSILSLLWMPAATATTNVVVFWLMAVCLAYRYRNTRTFLTGLFVGLGAAIKILPGVLAALYLWRRDLRFFAGLVVMLVFTSAIALAIDVRIFAHYWVSGREASTETIARADNLGLLPFAYNHAGVFGLALALAFATGLVWANRKHLFTPVGTPVSPYAWWLMAYFAFLLLPIAWIYSFIVLLPVVVYFFVQRSPVAIGLALLSFILLHIMRPYNNPYLALVGILIGIGFYLPPPPAQADVR